MSDNKKNNVKKNDKSGWIKTQPVFKKYQIEASQKACQKLSKPRKSSNTKKK